MAVPLMLDFDLAPPPNFISDIFYLTIGMGHYGYQRTIHHLGETAKHLDDIQRHLDYLNGDGSWMGVIDCVFNAHCLRTDLNE